MNKALFGALVASTFGLGALPAISADLTGDDRTELRARADRLTSQRVQNPQASDMRFDQNPSDVKIKPRGDVKAKPAKMKKPKAKGKSAVRRVKDGAKKIPPPFDRR